MPHELNSIVEIDVNSRHFSVSPAAMGKRIFSPDSHIMRDRYTYYLFDKPAIDALTAAKREEEGLEANDNVSFSVKVKIDEIAPQLYVPPSESEAAPVGGFKNYYYTVSIVE